jgi:5'-nucleotidase
MKILVTNDDGLEASGLADCVRALAGNEVVVVVPESQQSATSACLTLRRPIAYRHATLEGAVQVYACDGTPVDAAKLALGELLPWKPDLLVSGYNHGINVGQDVLYSGTIAAAMEGLFIGIPSLAISLQRPLEVSSSVASKMLPDLVKIAAEWNGAGQYLISVNFPANLAPAVVIARHGVSAFKYWYHKETGDDARCWIQGEPEYRDITPDTDAAVLATGNVAVTILKCDFDVFPCDARSIIADLAFRIATNFPVLYER